MRVSGCTLCYLTFIDIKEQKVGWIEKLGIPLILAAVSGLTFIAYKYPKGYERISKPIVIFTCLCFVGVFAWFLGTMHSNIRWLQRELENSPKEEISEISSQITGLNHSWTFLLWAFVIFVIVIGYLIFLYYLPNILGGGGQPTE